MEPILEVEEGSELVSSLFDKHVLDYRQWKSQQRSCVFIYR